MWVADKKNLNKLGVIFKFNLPEIFTIFTASRDIFCAPDVSKNAFAALNPLVRGDVACCPPPL